MHGELQALDISPRAKGYQGMGSECRLDLFVYFAV